VWNLAISKIQGAYRSLIDLTPIGDAERASEAFAGGNVLKGAGYTALAASGFIPVGGGAVAGTKAAVRAGMAKLGLADDVLSGVRKVLSSGAGQAWGVRAAEDGGAIVNRFVKGNNTVSSVVWTYIIDAKGQIGGIAKQAYEETGNILGTLKNYR